MMIDVNGDQLTGTEGHITQRNTAANYDLAEFRLGTKLITLVTLRTGTGCHLPARISISRI